MRIVLPMARSKETKHQSGEDVVLVRGRSEDGSKLAVLRKRGDEISAGLIERAEEGKPVLGELVRLVPREETPLLCDVEVLHQAPRPQTDGPAQVSTAAYRRGWDSIWGDSSAEGHGKTPTSLPN